MEINWPKLSRTLIPAKGERIAIIHEPMADIMLLIDLNRLFVIMSDSKNDKESEIEIVNKARGDVLLLGFGLGLILIPIMNKEEVTSITVLEIEPEVIELIASQIKLNDKVHIVIGDGLFYVPNRTFDIIYYDLDVPPERIIQLEKQGINTDPESHYRPYLKPDGQFIMWECNYGKYRG